MEADFEENARKFYHFPSRRHEFLSIMWTVLHRSCCFQALSISLHGASRSSTLKLWEIWLSESLFYMQSTKNRPFFVSLLPFVQDIDRFAVFVHCYATHASSGIHITHVHKFSLIEINPIPVSCRRWKQHHFKWITFVATLDLHYIVALTALAQSASFNFRLWL